MTTRCAQSLALERELARRTVLFIEGCDFVRFPPGGQLSFAKQVLKAFPDRLALVGVSDHAEDVGRWSLREISGRPFPFFAFARTRKAREKRPFVPGRLEHSLKLLRYRREVLSPGIRSAFIQAPELALVAGNWGWRSWCYMFHGVQNPLSISRFKFARPFQTFFERSVFRSVASADAVLAAADGTAISEMIARSGGLLLRDRISEFPTRFDAGIFHPMEVRDVRVRLGIALDAPVIAVSGRIGRFKGWDLLLEAFVQFREWEPRALLIFIGSGEDEARLRERARTLGIKESVRVTGFQTPESVAEYLNAANVVAVGSYAEGWSIAMLEALACGLPIVSTAVSGTGKLIRTGENGFVMHRRSPAEFAAALGKAVALQRPNPTSLMIARGFTSETLGPDLARVWQPFCGPVGL